MTDGTVAVVDWPWACNRAAWFDQLLLCINVDLYGGHDPEKLVRHYLETVNRDDITAALAGVRGYFTDVARQPSDTRAFPPASLPTSTGPIDALAPQPPHNVNHPTSMSRRRACGAWRFAAQPCGEYLSR
jgi:hypothetical protein